MAFLLWIVTRGMYQCLTSRSGKSSTNIALYMYCTVWPTRLWWCWGCLWRPWAPPPRSERGSTPYCWRTLKKGHLKIIKSDFWLLTPVSWKNELTESVDRCYSLKPNFLSKCNGFLTYYSLKRKQVQPSAPDHDTKNVLVQNISRYKTSHGTMRPANKFLLFMQLALIAFSHWSVFSHNKTSKEAPCHQKGSE